MKSPKVQKQRIVKGGARRALGLPNRASHLKIEGDLKIDRAGLRRRSVRDRPRELLYKTYFVYRISYLKKSMV